MSSREQDQHLCDVIILHDDIPIAKLISSDIQSLQVSLPIYILTARGAAYFLLPLAFISTYRL